MRNGATTGWNPPPHFPMATWYFCDASVQRIFKHFPSHPTQFSNPFRQRQIFENVEIHLGGERTHTLCQSRDEWVFTSLQFLRVNCMCYHGENEVEDFFWPFRLLGRSESSKCLTDKQRHRKEPQWLQAYTWRQNGKVKINIQGLSETIPLFNHF